MTRSAASLALVLSLAAAPASRVMAQEAPASSPKGGTDVDWLRVGKLEPGREITVAIHGSWPAERYFVSANDTDLTVLNLTNPTLPDAAVRALREIAARHPEYLEGAAKGELRLSNDVRLASAELFVAGEKVAGLRDVVDTSARTDVAEIRTRQKGRGVWGRLGVIGGYFVGALAGGYVAGYLCKATAGSDRCDSGAFMSGALIGGIAGGLYGFHAANRETENVIYSAPR